MDLLGQVIYFGPSEEEMQRQELMDKLSSIDASIGDVSSKVDSLADQINASIKIIDAQLDNISIKLDKDNISNVASIATSLRNEMNNYDTVLNSQIHTWYENKKLNDYLTAGSFILKVPNGQQTTTGVEIPNIDDQQMNDLDMIFVDDDLMSSTINSYIQEKLVSDHNDGWNADEKDDIVKEIFKRIILSDSFNKNSGSEFDTLIKKVYPSYTNWDVFTNKDEAIEKISSAGYASLCEVAGKNIANKLIENDLDCKIVDSIPSENIGNQIYNSTNGILYIWNNGSYVEYDPNANIASKGVFLAEEDTQQHEGVDNDSEIFTSKFSNKVMNTGDYPCDSSSNLNLHIQLRLFCIMNYI